MGEKDIFRRVTKDSPPAQPVPQNIKERLYERIKIPLPVLDGIIALLFIAILVFTIIGMVEGNR